MKKVLVIALLTFALLANCIAFATESVDTTVFGDTNGEQSIHIEKSEKYDRHDHGGRETKPEREPKPVPEKDRDNSETQAKPEKPVEPEKNETTVDPEINEDTTGDAIDEETAEDATGEDISDVNRRGKRGA